MRNDLDVLKIDQKKLEEISKIIKKEFGCNSQIISMNEVVISQDVIETIGHASMKILQSYFVENDLVNVPPQEAYARIMSEYDEYFFFGDDGRLYICVDLVDYHFITIPKEKWKFIKPDILH